MEKIIIIGGAGYIGTVLINDLLKYKYKVICLDNNIYKNKNSIKIFRKNKNFTYKNFDLRKYKKINNLIDTKTSIVLLAGLVGDPISKKYPKLSKEINDTGISRFIDFLKNKEFNKLIFVSTCSNYGLSKSKKLLNENSKLNPISNYAKAKVKIEKNIKSKKS